MKKIIAVGAIIAFFCSLGIASAAQATLALKAGDTAYVCKCGTDCGCDTVSKKEGKCGCGHDLVKVTVDKVKGSKASFQLEGKAHSVKLKGAYSCACGGDCCQLISQKPGKCSCGKDLVAVAKKK